MEKKESTDRNGEGGRNINSAGKRINTGQS